MVTVTCRTSPSLAAVVSADGVFPPWLPLFPAFFYKHECSLFNRGLEKILIIEKYVNEAIAKTK